MSPFRAFLGTKGLGDRSILEAERAVHFLRSGFTSNARSASRRTSLEWAASLWKDFSGEELVVHSAKPPEHERLKPAISMPDEDWERLWRVLSSGLTDAGEAVEGVEVRSPAAAVIRVMMVTGLRIEDVLRIPPTAIAGALSRADGLLEAKIKGGKVIKTSVAGSREAWAQLHAVTARSPTVAHAVAPGGSGTSAAGSGAYMACSRLLHKASKAAGCSGRAHLHRLRRTVVVQGLRSGIDVVQIASSVGHSSINTTSRYADEKHPEIAAHMQEAIAKFRGKR
jgi:integrase